MCLENGHNAQHWATYASSTTYEHIGGTSEHPAIEEADHWSLVGVELGRNAGHDIGLGLVVASFAASSPTLILSTCHDRSPFSYH